MFCFLLNLAVITMLTGKATSETFAGSAEMNITLCPISYYGEKYEKIYVSFSANTFALCFKGLYKPGVKNDCILVSKGAADRGSLEVLKKEIPFGSLVHKLLPDLMNSGKCVSIIQLTDGEQSEIEQLELGNFGTQAVVAVKTLSGYKDDHVEVDLQVDGLTVSKKKLEASETNNGVFLDISGCRLSGRVYKTNTKVLEPNICSTVTCQVNGVANAISDCGPMERCQGNGSCVVNSVCTVIGPAVIDFIGRVHSVPDRCAYTLLGSSSVPELQVLGVFQERRRKDVFFLDQVLLQLKKKGLLISMGQGSTVHLSNKELKLNASGQVIHGVEFSRNQSGVTAKISACDGTVSVFFDGNTALIHMTGPSVGTVHGLCDDSKGTLCDDKVSEHSATDCEIQYEDSVDGTINCNRATEWCNFFTQEPFAACHSHMSPKPFIAACTQTLCKYPAVDGLRCLFLQAYAQVCSSHSKLTMEGWRSKTRCSATSQASCQNRFCSAHEFCGPDGSKETRCYCRAIFASRHKPTNSFGEVIKCGPKTVSVALADCLLADAGIDHSALHLNDQSCKGEIHEQTHMVIFNFSSSNPCGSVITRNDDQIVFKNTIKTHNSSTVGSIIRHGQINIDLSCYYTEPVVKSLAIKVRQSPVVQQITSGNYVYNLTMTPSAPPVGMKPADETLRVEMKTEGLDGELIALVTDSCWATDQPSASGSQRHDVIISGCPANQAVRVESNGQGTSNQFSVNTLRFSSQTGYVYLHCKVKLCIRKNEPCVPKCSKTERRRRRVVPTFKDENPALITLVWSH
ncbi:alpha-tectorin-like [Menidia menidia]